MAGYKDNPICRGNYAHCSWNGTKEVSNRRRAIPLSFLEVYSFVYKTIVARPSASTATVSLRSNVIEAFPLVLTYNILTVGDQ